jgi:hypothetical protein
MKQACILEQLALQLPYAGNLYPFIWIYNLAISSQQAK